MSSFAVSRGDEGGGESPKIFHDVRESSTHKPLTAYFWLPTSPATRCVTSSVRLRLASPAISSTRWCTWSCTRASSSHSIKDSWPDHPSLIVIPDQCYTHLLSWEEKNKTKQKSVREKKHTPKVCFTSMPWLKMLNRVHVWQSGLEQ